MQQERVLVLGAASWLGYLLLNQLGGKHPAMVLGGTLHHLDVDFETPVTKYKPTAFDAYVQAINEFAPTVLVNFLRGEDEEGLQIHQHCINYASANSAYYLYASSVLALDGYTDVPLTENLPANSISEYGIFKGRCEDMLRESSINWCALRFASLQGWVPHRITRNENLLKKLQTGQQITVDRGVVQNRMLAADMVKGVAMLIAQRVNGIIHFGTTDSSEEYEFLRNQAQAFGYPPELVASGSQRKVNLVAVPGRVFELFGDEFKTTEQDTLNGLLAIPQLKQYNNPN